jgi:hypothetical protein
MSWSMELDIAAGETTSQLTPSGTSPVARTSAPTPDAKISTVSTPPPITTGSWALPVIVTKILALRNTSCLPFEPSNYHVTTSIKTLPKPLCPADPAYAVVGYGDYVYERYEDACLGAYCAYALDSALRSYETLNTSKPMWTSTRLVFPAVYDKNNKVVG